jgi:hypothetical protein
VLAFRFLYGLRLLSPFVIGTTHISYRRFLLLNAMAALVWAGIFATLGFVLGDAAQALTPAWPFDTRRTGIGAGLTIIITLAGLMLTRRLWPSSQRRADPPERQGRSVRDDHDAQRRLPTGDGQQTIDIGMSAGAVAGIGHMLAKQQQAMFGSGRVKRAEDLGKIVVDRQRALLARLVPDAGHHGALRIDQVDAGQSVDGRQLLEIIGENRARLDRFRHGIKVLKVHWARATSSFPRPVPPGLQRPAPDIALRDCRNG